MTSASAKFSPCQYQIHATSLSWVRIFHPLSFFITSTGTDIIDEWPQTEVVSKPGTMHAFQVISL